MNSEKMNNAIVRRPEQYSVQEFDWGRLVWMISGPDGSSETMTVGMCYIKPGQANPVHFHPNCDEVLHMLQGRISHTRGTDPEVEMQAMDTISIPSGVPHNARNVGDQEAIMLVSFSSADRKMTPVRD